MKKVIILAILMILFSSVSYGQLTTWRNRVRCQLQADSIWRIPEYNGITADSTKRTNIYSYDTTMTVAMGNYYSVDYKFYYPGIDSPIVETYVLNLLEVQLYDGEYTEIADTTIKKLLDFNISSFADSTSGELGWYVQIAGDSSIWADAGAITSLLDTVLWFAGNKDNAYSFSVFGANVDSVFFGIGTTPLFGIALFHVGGATGDAPDSTHTFSYAER